MILKNSSYQEFAEKIKKEKKKLIIYGAGMIGQIVLPSILQQYHLVDNVLYYVDRDPCKKGQRIRIGETHFEIKAPETLYQIEEDIVILITNSNFYPIVAFLDGVEVLNDVETYLYPVMQLLELNDTPAPIIVKSTDKSLIPKKIHYCWFSDNPIPEPLQKCIDSWKEKCPDYEIVCWNEKNYDVNQRRYTAEAYANQKYGFVSDVARWDILYEHGGIYLDTDVELYKNLDELLYQEAFVGTEKWGNINSGGGCGAIPHHPMVKKLSIQRDMISFVKEDSSLNLDTNGIYETKVFLESGFQVKNETQIIDDVSVYPPFVFHPYDYVSCEETRKDETFSIHYFSGTWMDEKGKKNRAETQEKYAQVLKRMEE